ncbi:hypothetical protein ACIA5D_36480 [Actinoplanes sp. NPDC051513]|uniref:hypothetical protein n=1 Tax=Actinoplanes sp. NPDC051513 TaxID=3363908 RepID=UPI0037988727
MTAAQPSGRLALVVDEMHTAVSQQEIHQMLDVIAAEMRDREAVVAGQAAHPVLGEIGAGEPVYLVAVNPWRPWVARAGGTALGAGMSAIVSVALNPQLMYTATLITIAVALVFAWVLGGYELTEKHPKKFVKAQ